MPKTSDAVALPAVAPSHPHPAPARFGAGLLAVHRDAGLLPAAAAVLATLLTLWGLVAGISAARVPEPVMFVLAPVTTFGSMVALACALPTNRLLRHSAVVLSVLVGVASAVVVLVSLVG